MKILCKEECSVDRVSVKEKGKGFTLLTSVLLLFMPKCALCWAAYMSFLSSIGIVIKYQSWFLPVMSFLFVCTLLKLLISSIRRKNFLAFGMALIAGLIIFSERSTVGIDPLKIFALVLMAAAVMMDSFVKLFRLIKLNKVM